MSIESLTILEEKMQSLIDKFELNRMEIEELRSDNSRLLEENERLKSELSSWNDRIGGLVNRLEGIPESPEPEVA